MERPVDWLPAINDDTEDCPPFAVVMITEVDVFGNLHFTRYDGSPSPILFFNGEGAIPSVTSIDTAVGAITRTFPATAAYSGVPAPLPGEVWGPVEDTWLLQPEYPGFTILGGAGLGAVNVIEQVGSYTEPSGLYRVRMTATTLGAAYTRTDNTIVADANGALGTIDSVTPAVDNRILLRSGDASAGIYTITALGGASDKFVLVRSSDADTSAELPSGTLVTVSEGTVSADTVWMLTTNDPITLNTTSLVFTQKAPGITSINSLTAAAQTLAVGTAGTDFAISSSADTHTFNLPYASASAIGGKISNLPQAIGGSKYFVDAGGTGGIITGVGSGGSTIEGGTSGAGVIELCAPAAEYYSQYTYCVVFSNVLGATYTGGDYRSNCKIVPDVNSSTDPFPSPPSPALYAAARIEANYYDSGGSSTTTWLTVYNSASEGYAVLNSGTTMDAVYAVSHGGTTYKGVSGTSGGGDTVKGGIITALGSGGGVTIGNPVGGGTGNYILFVDGSGNLAQSADFQWDNTAKSLTLGTSGYLVGSKVGAPTLGTNSTIAGPYIKDF